MPSLPQLPEATSAHPTDKVMLDQSGVSRAATVATLQNGLQPKLTLAQGALLGRVSPNPGAPEAVTLGAGLNLANGALGADTTVIAPLASPAFSGIPTAPTPPPNDSSAAIATTAFVQAKYSQPLTLAGDVVSAPALGMSGALTTTLANIATAGTFTKVTVNAKGQVTAGSSTLTPSDIAGLAAAFPVQSVGGKTGAVTDLSTASTTSPGSTTARSLADRAQETLNVRDFGAVLDGVTDDTAALARAQQAAQNKGGALITIPSGNLYLAGTVYTISGNGWLFQPGVTISGPGQILGLTDQIKSNVGLAIAKFSAEPEGASTLFVSNFVGGTNSPTSYEKNAIYARIVTGDSSSGAVQRDAVAGEFQAQTQSGTTLGRIWGINPIATVVATSDAYALGAEIAVENYGQAQPLVDQPNSKVGVNIIAGGPQLSSAALIINGGSSNNSGANQWSTGIFIKDVAIAGKALRIATVGSAGWTDVASIDKAGNAQFNTLAIVGNGAASSYSSTWTAGNPGNGSFQWNFTGSVPSAGVIGPLTTVYNNGPHCAQAEKFQYFSQAGAADSVDNAQTLIGIYNPGGVSGANMGAELVRWTVGITPQDTAHNWTHVVEEYNVVNRGLDMGWKAYRNDPVNSITGPQQITGLVNYSPEATGLGQPGEGKNLLFAELFGQSAATNSSGLPARFYNASLYEPNCVVGGTGRAIYINGDLTGLTPQIPYAPIEINLTWMHGLRTTTATFQDGQALTMATSQAIAWINGTSTAKISSSGSGANQDLILSPSGTGAVRLTTVAGLDSTGVSLATSNGTVFQIKDNGSPALSRLVVTPGNTATPTILAVSGEANQGLNIRSAGNGQINFQSGTGGGSNALTIVPNATAVNALAITGGNIGQNVVLGVNGSDANVSIQITPQGTGSVAIARLAATGGTIDATAIGTTTPSTGTFTTVKATNATAADSTGIALGTSNGTVVQIKDNGASALSKLVITPGNASTPAVVAVSGETNQGLNIRSAGNGQINFQSGTGGGSNALTIVPNATAVNALAITGGNTGQNVVLGVNGSDANVSIQITPQGTGSVAIARLAATGGTIDATAIGTTTPSTGTFTTVKATTATAADSTGIALGTSNGTVLQIKDNGASALSKLVITPGNASTPAVVAVSGETNQGLNIRSAGNGQINFQSGTGGGSNALTIVPNATAVNALAITGGNTGQNVVLGVNGSDANVSIQITPQGTGSVAIARLAATGGTIDATAIGTTTPSTGIFTTVKATNATAADSTGIALGTSNGTVLQIKDNGASALSKLVITPGNASTPAVVAVSGETNQGLNIRSAGNGQINFQSGTGGSSNALTIVPNASAVNALSVTGASTGQSVILGVNGADTNVSIQISPQGSGTVAIAKLAATGGSIDATSIGATTAATGSFTTLKASGLASFSGGLADASMSVQTPTTSFAITAANGVSTLQLTPASTLAFGSITLPSAPGNGQWLLIASTAAITSCSFLPGAGQTILGAPTSLSAFSEVAFQYQSSSTRWICQSGNDSRVTNAASSTNLLFGTSADGAVTLSSGTTTLTRDMHYASLTLSGTGAIAANGFRIYVSSTLDISAAQSGAIFVTTYVGTAASGATAGAASTTNSFAANALSLPIPFQAGAAGGAGNASAGSAGGAVSTVNSWGGDAGVAGAGGAGNSGSQAAGAAGSSGSGVLQSGFFFGAAIPSYPTTGSGSRISAGISAAGGGGGGGDGTNSGGGGGGGGYGGGTLLINARTIARGSNVNASIFQAKGGNGGNGGNCLVGNAAGGGGGGGGGGGFIGIVTETLAGSTIANAIDTSGGTGGTGGNGLGTGKGGTGGAGGGSGYQHLIVLSTPAVPTTSKTAGTTATSATTSTGTAGAAGAIVRGSL